MRTVRTWFERAVRSTARQVTHALTRRARRRMGEYTHVETYQPLAGLDTWLETRGDRDGLVASAIAPSVRDVYESRFVDVREPTLIEHGHGYLFIRRGLYRASFNWWQLDTGPGLRSLVAYARWLVFGRAPKHFPEVVSLRTRWEQNFWHCHDEVISKLLLVETARLPPTIPLLVGAELWAQPFFQQMLDARSLRRRNWVVHDADVTADRAILCIQGPTRFENALFARDVLDAQERRSSSSPAEPTRLLVLRPRRVERHFVNEEAVISALEPLGFRAVRTDDMTYWEQAGGFVAAECVVMAHGAALANLIHRIGQSTGVVEIFPRDPRYVRRVYGPWLCKEASFAYRAVVASSMVAGGIVVPMGDLTTAVTTVLGELARPIR